MNQDTKDTVQSLIGGVDIIVNSLNSVDRLKRFLQEVYESHAAEIPRAQLLSDLERLMQIIERIKDASGFQDKVELSNKEIIPLVIELKERYRDFLSDEAIQELTDLAASSTALDEIFVAQGFMILAFNTVENPKEQAQLLYTGLVKLSESLEKHIRYFSIQLKEYLKIAATAILNDPSFNSENYHDDLPLYGYVVGIKNTARSVLWQIEHYQERTDYPIRKLLDWVETNPGWAGDDFDECLDYVNRARKG